MLELIIEQSDSSKMLKLIIIKNGFKFKVRDNNNVSLGTLIIININKSNKS